MKPIHYLLIVALLASFYFAMRSLWFEFKRIQSENKQFELQIEERRKADKEIVAIKKYIAEKRKEALRDHGNNTALLVFIQKLEEAFTWVREVK